eukprot:6074145-Alexandrium_andersonii.AAC.1
MSASLVGSEMCIRDRGAPLRAPTPVLRRRTEAPLPAPPPPLPHPRRPVSYTHLTLPTICSV